MLGFVSRILVLALGYAYPAFECYKSVEKNRVDIEELRFWCQYWIIAALLTVFERLGDIFISWFPLYGELKLALYIYLWYPKTKGTKYVYESFLRPCIAKHETDIDRKILEFRTRGKDLVSFYWRNCASLGQETFLQVLKFLVVQSAKVTGIGPKKPDENDSRQTPGNKTSPPMPPPPPGTNTLQRTNSEPSQSRVQRVHPDSQPDCIDTRGVAPFPDEPASKSVPDKKLNEKLHSARLRLRRHKLV